MGLTRRTLAPFTAWRTARAPATLTLADVRRRLELLLAAMYGRPFRIAGSAPSRTRAGGPTGLDLTSADVILPPVLPDGSGRARAAERYRLLAIEQAARVVRGTMTDALPVDPLERDLYLLAEGASIDRDIASRAPGLVAALTESRHEERGVRPPLGRLRPVEREVESLVQTVLGGDVGDTSAVPQMPSCDASRQWASEEAARLRQRAGVAPPYRRVRRVGLWALDVSRPLSPSLTQPMSGAGDVRNASTAREADTGRLAESRANGRMEGDPTESGTGSPTTVPGAEGTGSTTADAAGGGPTAAAQGAEEDPHPGRGGVSYPEWDEYAGRYLPGEVTVRAGVARETEEDWALEALRVHAPLVRQVRARFAPLRARRTRLRAQRAAGERSGRAVCADDRRLWAEWQ